ncbi:MAG: hypothetical protein P1U74_03340 [Legionellaceae bacterium]|nr:hypothetical protein [Legionellaceae bacterium]
MENSEEKTTQDRSLDHQERCRIRQYILNLTAERVNEYLIISGRDLTAEFFKIYKNRIESLLNSDTAREFQKSLGELNYISSIETAIDPHHKEILPSIMEYKRLRFRGVRVTPYASEMDEVRGEIDQLLDRLKNDIKFIEELKKVACKMVAEAPYEDPVRVEFYNSIIQFTNASRLHTEYFNNLVDSLVEMAQAEPRILTEEAYNEFLRLILPYSNNNIAKSNLYVVMLFNNVTTAMINKLQHNDLNQTDTRVNKLCDKINEIKNSISGVSTNAYIDMSKQMKALEILIENAHKRFQYEEDMTTFIWQCLCTMVVMIQKAVSYISAEEAEKKLDKLKPNAQRILESSDVYGMFFRPRNRCGSEPAGLKNAMKMEQERKQYSCAFLTVT